LHSTAFGRRTRGFPCSKGTMKLLGSSGRADTGVGHPMAAKSYSLPLRRGLGREGVRAQLEAWRSHGRSRPLPPGAGRSMVPMDGRLSDALPMCESRIYFSAGPHVFSRCTSPRLPWRSLFVFFHQFYGPTWKIIPTECPPPCTKQDTRNPSTPMVPDDRGTPPLMPVAEGKRQPQRLRHPSIEKSLIITKRHIYVLPTRRLTPPRSFQKPHITLAT